MRTKPLFARLHAYDTCTLPRTFTLFFADANRLPPACDGVNIMTWHAFDGDDKLSPFL